MSLRVIHVELADANAFVGRVHRHHDPVVGHRWSIGAADEAGVIRAVAIVGRPVARRIDPSRVVEVTRLASDGTRNACTILYGAAARAAEGAGYDAALTYTLASEGGASLRASGFVWARSDLTPTESIEEATVAAASWSKPSRPRDRSADLFGETTKMRVDAEAKVRWVRWLNRSALAAAVAKRTKAGAA